MGQEPLGVVQVQILTTTPRNAISTALEQEQMNKYEEMEAKEDQAARPRPTKPGSDRARIRLRGLLLPFFEPPGYPVPCPRHGHHRGPEESIFTEPSLGAQGWQVFSASCVI